MTRTVLITGAAGGIGRALSSAFLAQGDTVFLADRDAEATHTAATELGGTPLPLDITDADAVSTALEQIAGQHGPLDVLVNNAGLMNVHGGVRELDVDAYRGILDVNVLGTFTMTQQTANHMIARGNAGTIVNISSIGSRQPTPGMGAYESSKAAVDSLTRWAAIELAEHGIRVNAVAPGPVLTPMLAAGMPEGSEAHTAWTSRIPDRRFAATSDVADAAVFLASEGASHITGVSLPVDGGQLLT